MSISAHFEPYSHFLSLSSQWIYKQYSSERQKTIYRDIRLPDERSRQRSDWFYIKSGRLHSVRGHQGGRPHSIEHMFNPRQCRAEDLRQTRPAECHAPWQEHPYRRCRMYGRESEGRAHQEL